MESFLVELDKVNSKIGDVLWGPLTLFFIIFVGLFLSIKFKFFQILKVKIWMKNTIGSVLKKKKPLSNGKNNEIGVSPFQAVSTALGGCIGTGNIVGVATALSIGGPGSLFWMWTAAILGMMTSFVENTLAIKYREKGKDGQFIGGPMLYMHKRLNCKFVAMIFSVTTILVTFGTGNMVQSNSISKAFKDSFKIPEIATGFILAILTIFVIFGGISKIVKLTGKMVPIMTGLYLLGGSSIIICNFSKIGGVFSSIISNAFDFRSVGGSFAGCSAILAMRSGIARGLFSNEAGLGSSPIVHASSNVKDSKIQGMWGIFQVFVDTVVVCTVTGLGILISNDGQIKGEGVEITKNAFSSIMGDFGGMLVYIILILFAFSTIIGWSYVGEKAVQYLFGLRAIKIYKIFVCLVTILGSIMELKAVWSLCDNLNALMMIPNLIAILFLSNEVYKDFKTQSLN